MTDDDHKEDRFYDMSHPMPLLGNSNSDASTGGRFISLMSSAGGGQSARIAEWKTQEREPQELELLLFPLNTSEGAITLNASQSVMLRFVLTVAVGPAGGTGSSFDTGLSMPMNGLRYRFRGKAANLTVYAEGVGNVAVALFAAFFPVCADTSGIVSMDTTTTGSYQQIPKGARAFRISKGVSSVAGPGNSVVFQDMAGNTLATFTTAVDWTDIPRGAFAFQSSSDWPGAGEKINYGNTIYFRN